MRTIVFVAIMFMLSIGFRSNAQPVDTTLNNIYKKTSYYIRNHEQENVYLHFDKPCYAAGDTIYFKAYVTLGERHRLSALSGVLHADLINTNNKIDRSIKLELKNGMTWGDFALPDSLPGGNYHIRAYTRWMQNKRNDFYFNRDITVYAVKSAKTINRKVTLTNLKPDIQFMPEGGSLIEGVLSKVAFKAIGPNGLGMAVRGTITDQFDHQVCSFSALNAGMGFFDLQPLAGISYKATLIYTNGKQDIVDLPKPLSNGMCLSVTDSLSKASVKIEANEAYYQENKNKSFLVLIYSGGLLTKLSCTLDSRMIMFDVLKRHLHTGIATITLFSPDGLPLCERLFFVQKYDSLNINVNSDQVVYKEKEKIKFSINVKNRADFATQGHFSVTVVNGDLVNGQDNADNILSYFLLTADLKGQVEQPGYYFTDITDKKLQELDLVMLTHGYRRWEWKQVLDEKSNDVIYQPESGIEITGTLKNLFGKPIPKGTVTLLPDSGGQVLTTLANDKGLFKFQNLSFTDSMHFVLSGVNAKGRNLTTLSFNPAANDPPVHPVLDRTLLTNLDSLSTEKSKLLKQDLLSRIQYKGRLLREVKIKAVKIDDQYKTQSLAGAGHADQVMHADEIQQIQGTLTTSLNGRLRGVTFVNSKHGKVPALTAGFSPMLLIVDGTEVAPDFINYMSVNEIETIEVLKRANASMYGMNGGGGVLVISTKQGGGRELKDIHCTGILPIAVAGFYKAKEFYLPKYAVAQTAKQTDFRSTIYWKPELITDKNGNASFEYYDADGTGTYQLIIEGIDDKGNIGRQMFRYKVE